jgi:ubiquinone biosynthesis protein
MSRVLTQLFEITALFDMRLRPELVLLQKTMMTVEGVARRIDPEHDIWAASDPVVRRWMARELSPQARIRRFTGEAETALRTLARLAEGSSAPGPVVVAPGASPTPGAVWFALGALVAAVAFLAGALLR